MKNVARLGLIAGLVSLPLLGVYGCSDNSNDGFPTATSKPDAGGSSGDDASDDATVGDDATVADAAGNDASDDASTGNEDASGDDASGDDAAMDATSGDDDGSMSTDAGDAGPLTTIAAARKNNVTTPITVQAIVTALHGTIPNDVSEWYVEDPAGGVYSGVVVYCDPDKAACPTSVRAPARGTLVQITGSLTTYKNQIELIPTAQTVVAMNQALPPIPSVSITEIAQATISQYRGVLVKLAAGTTLTVDSVTPAALYDTGCTTKNDAGAFTCSHACSPPAYSGFTANDGHGHEVNVEDTFFATDPLQSSPECTSETGVVPVNVGMTFSAMQGVLDFDGYAAQQQLSPVVTTDYTTP